MKNVFIAAALVLALSANASVTTISNKDAVTLTQEKEYKKIDTGKVPAAILQEISTKYSGYKITEAAVADDGEYRITVAKDTVTIKIYYTAAGEFVKEQK